MSNIQKNISAIIEDIKHYSPYPEKVKLVAVTKFVDTNAVKEVLNAGICSMGENRVQILKEKREILKDEKIEWHLIGQLQKNKIKYISEYIALIHSVDSYDLAREIDKHAAKAGRIIDVLLEVNISGEASKSGYTLEQLHSDSANLTKLSNINIKGLMTMAPLTDNDEVIRNVFKNLALLKTRLNEESFGNSLQELSMGMTNDYKIALQEGATLIRIGTKMFK